MKAPQGVAAALRGGAAAPSSSAPPAAAGDAVCAHDGFLLSPGEMNDGLGSYIHVHKSHGHGLRSYIHVHMSHGLRSH
jgi:hypothetical protein